VARVSQRIDEVIGGRVLEAGLTGSRATRFAFDPEYDPALILFEEVGPLGPDGRPTVANAFYVKAFGEMYLTDTVGIFGQVIYGRLLRAFQRFRLDCECVRDAGPAEELGVEIDAGVTWRINELLAAELRMGYLVSGSALGPGAEDVFMIRPQVGASW
jgi:hypothetical protein